MNRNDLSNLDMTDKIAEKIAEKILEERQDWVEEYIEAKVNKKVADNYNRNPKNRKTYGIIIEKQARKGGNE